VIVSAVMDQPLRDALPGLEALARRFRLALGGAAPDGELELPSVLRLTADPVSEADRMTELLHAESAAAQAGKPSADGPASGTDRSPA
jgi:hypothetical protein